MTSYNLLTEPWIPVRGLNDQVQQKGIVDTLVQAHELAGIVDPAPPVQLGIYRLLIAFLMDVYQLKGIEDLGDVIEIGHFDREKIEKYAETWHDRFDLFDAKHPFMQVPLDDVKKAKEPISRLMQHIPAGTNVSHFFHGNWNKNAYSFEQCARGLVTIPPFMTAGGAGLSPSINGIPPWYVLISGNSLFKRLAFNLCVIPLRVKTADDHVPVWRNNDPDVTGESKSFSIVEALTWRPRSIFLVPNGSDACTYSGKQNCSTVRMMYFAPGYKAPEPGMWIDPYAPYIITNDGIRPLRPQENKELWRDTGPLMLLQQKDYSRIDGKISFERPAIVNQYKLLISKNIITDPKDCQLSIEVYGIRTDGHAKIFEWYFEQLTIPEGMLRKNNAGKYAQDAMDFSDSVAYAIKVATKKAYPDTKANDIALNNLILRSQSSYWRALKPLFDDHVIKKLSAMDENDPNAPITILQDWKKILEKEGIKAFNDCIGPLDADGKMLKRQVEASEYYWLKVKSSLYPEVVAEKKRKGRREANLK